MTTLQIENSALAHLEERLKDLSDPAPPSFELVDTLNELARRGEVEIGRRLALSQEAQVHATRLGYIEGLVRSLLQQSRIIRGSSPGPALSQAIEALALAQSLKDPQLEAEIRHSISEVYRYLEQFSAALQYGLASLDIYRRIGDPREADMLTTLGVIYSEMGKRDRAITIFLQVLEMLKTSGNRESYARVLNNLAYNYFQQGKHEQARPIAEESVAIYRDLRSTRTHIPNYPFTLETLSSILRELGDLDQALRYALLARDENRLADGSPMSNNVEAALLANLARIHIAKGNQDRAQAIYEELLEFGTRNQLKAAQVEALQELVVLYEQQGAHAHALEALRRCYQVERTLQHEKSNKRLHNLQVMHDTETARREAQLLQAENRKLEQTVTALEKAKADLQDALSEVQHQTAMQAILLEENERQRRTIQEQSVPVLPLTSEILVMPLVGSLDKERLRELQGQALTAIQHTGATYLLLDITGVSIIDSQVAQGIIAAVKATKLLGADTFLIGIRPEVAQAIVSLGLDLQGVRTASTLQTALQFLAAF